jgi:hypothetical protein
VTCAYPRASAGGLTDVDYDGVPDALELALAQKFMPKLWMSNTTDRDELYAFSGGGMPYRVDQVGGFTEVGQYLLIQYALPYDYQRAKCGFGSHTGDSEYVEVLVGRAPYYGTAYGGTSWENARTDVNAWAVFAGKANHHTSQTVVVIQDSKTTMPDKNRVPDLFIAAITHASFWAWDKCNNDAIVWPCYDVCQPLCNAKPKALLSMRNLDTQGTWGSMTKDPNTLVWDTYPMNSSANPNFGQEPGYYGKFHQQANYLNALSSCLGGRCDGPWFNQVVGFPDCQ